MQKTCGPVEIPSLNKRCKPLERSSTNHHTGKADTPRLHGRRLSTCFPQTKRASSTHSVSPLARSLRIQNATRQPETTHVAILPESHLGQEARLTLGMDPGVRKLVHIDAVRIVARCDRCPRRRSWRRRSTKQRRRLAVRGCISSHTHRTRRLLPRSLACFTLLRRWRAHLRQSAAGPTLSRTLHRPLVHFVVVRAVCCV